MKTTYFVTRFDVSILQRENFITKYSQNNRFFFSNFNFDSSGVLWI
jgi:hypothetical protein